MILNIIILLLLLVTIFLILKKSKLFIFSLIMIILVSILSKNTQENFSSLDILYGQNSMQTINRHHMLNNFKNPNTPNTIYKNTVQDENDNSKNIFENYIQNMDNNYILIKQIDNDYYILNGYIYDINNSELYLEKLNEPNLKMHQNYGLKLFPSNVDNTSYGFNIKLQPYNSKFNSSIPGFIQGQNNSNVIINPVRGNLNNIFYFTNCSDNIISEEENNNLNLLYNNNLSAVYNCKILCNNKLYFDVSTIEKHYMIKKRLY